MEDQRNERVEEAPRKILVKMVLEELSCGEDLYRPLKVININHTRGYAIEYLIPAEQIRRVWTTRGEEGKIKRHYQEIVIHWDESAKDVLTIPFGEIRRLKHEVATLEGNLQRIEIQNKNLKEDVSFYKNSTLKYENYFYGVTYSNFFQRLVFLFKGNSYAWKLGIKRHSRS